MLDKQRGATFAWGWEHVSTVLDEEGLLLDIELEGVPGAAAFRIGTAEFAFHEQGTTTLSFLLGTGTAIETFVLGRNAELLPNDEIELRDLAITSTSLASLEIVVLPEPAAGVLLLAGLACLLSRTPAGARRSKC